MKVCPNCFLDKELKGFISSSTEIGDCDVCNSKKQQLLNVAELIDFFQELLDNIEINDKGIPLSAKLQEEWNLFSTLSTAHKILNHVLPFISTDITSSNATVDYIDDIIANSNHWEVLKEELKWKNRFVINIERLIDLGWDGFFNTQFRLNKDVELFRARLHHQSGMQAYQLEEMICPSKEIVGGGRANPPGIPFLYLSDNPETVFYEVRASHSDELSVGTFQLKPHIDAIEIVDFTEDTPLFQPGKVNQIIKSKLLRQNISKDLSKPMRRYDNELEYISTQFICEFIRVFTGALGVRFKSSLHSQGNNIVLFDQELMNCKAVKLVSICKVKLEEIEI